MGMLSSRPKLSLPWSPLQRACRSFSPGSSADTPELAPAWPKLPATVPTHFGLGGQADNRGLKSTLLILPGIAALALRRAQRIGCFPAVNNYRVQLTEETVAQQSRISVDHAHRDPVRDRLDVRVPLQETAQASLSHSTGIAVLPLLSVAATMVTVAIGVAAALRAK